MSPEQQFTSLMGLAFLTACALSTAFVAVSLWAERNRARRKAHVAAVTARNAGNPEA